MFVGKEATDSLIQWADTKAASVNRAPTFDASRISRCSRICNVNSHRRVETVTWRSWRWYAEWIQDMNSWYVTCWMELNGESVQTRLNNPKSCHMSTFLNPDPIKDESPYSISLCMSTLCLYITLHAQSQQPLRGWHISLPFLPFAGEPGGVKPRLLLIGKS